MDDALLKRIAAIMPLFGASDDSEVLHAARATQRILREGNLTWADLAGRLLTPPPRALPPPQSAQVLPFPRGMPPERVPQWQTDYLPPERPPARVESVRRVKSAWAVDRDDIMSIFIRRGELDAWSTEFLESIHEQVQGGRSLTEKQRAKLNEILDKLGA